MGFNVNYENIDPDNPNGFSPLEPGFYHFQVESWEDNEAKEFLLLNFTIVGTEPGKELAIGRKHKESIFYKEKQREWAEKKVNALFIAVGILTIDLVRELKDKKKQMELDFDDIVGKTFVGKLSKGKDKDGNETKYNNLNFDYYTLDSEEAKSVNLNQAVIDNPGTIVGQDSA